MRAGKHVLVEKPLCSNSQEARQIFQVASETSLVALEAFHWRFHPAAHAVKELVEGGKYGRVTRTRARMVTPKNSIPGSDIRWKYLLGGGALMDEASLVPRTVIPVYRLV
jgi:predicted dehydrogenase